MVGLVVGCWFGSGGWGSTNNFSMIGMVLG